MGLLTWRIRLATRPCCCSQSNTPASKANSSGTLG
jgi:hypothetical protein